MKQGKPRSLLKVIRGFKICDEKASAGMADALDDLILDVLWKLDKSCGISADAHHQVEIGFRIFLRFDEIGKRG